MDNKAPTMAAFFALALLKELGLHVSKRIQLIIGTDEESHWRCVKHYFKHEEMPMIGFAPDADFPIIHAEKGIMDVMLTWNEQTSVDGRDESALKLTHFSAGERLNMVPDEAYVYIKGEQNDLMKVKELYSRFLERKGLKGETQLINQQLKLSCFGKAAHGSTPEVGNNAGTELACFLNNNIRLQKDVTTFLTFASLLHEDFFAKQLGLEMEDDVSGRLSINPGILTCSENGEAKLGLNIRYPVTMNGEMITKKLTAVATKYKGEYQVIDHMELTMLRKTMSLFRRYKAFMSDIPVRRLSCWLLVVGHMHVP